MTQRKYNSSYYSYIKSIIVEKIKPLYDKAKEIISNPKVNESALKALNNWPRSLDDLDEGPYNDCISCIVKVGMTTPLESINTLTLLSSDSPVYNELQKCFLDATQTAQLETKLFDLLIFSIFVDSVSQLYPSLAELNRDKTEISDNDRFIMDVCAKFSSLQFKGIPSTIVKHFFEPLSRKLFAQSAVIVGYYSTNQIQIATQSFTNALLNDPNVDIYGLFAQHRFLIYEPKFPLQFLQETILKFLMNHKEKYNTSDANYKYIVKFLKNLILQIDQTDDSTINNIITILGNHILKNNPQKVIFESILRARSDATDIDSIYTLFLKTFSKATPHLRLKAFLYMIRGPHFYPHNEFWGYGEINNPYSLAEERKLLFENEYLKETPEKNLVELFKAMISKMTITDKDTKVLTHIFYNLFQRKLSDNDVSNILLFVQLITNSDGQKNQNLACAFFNALTLYFDPTAEIMDAADIKEKIHAFITEQITRKKTIGPLNSKSSLMRIVSPESCPLLITPQDNIAPNSSLTAVFKRIEDACDTVNKSFSAINAAPNDKIDFTVPKSPNYMQHINPNKLKDLLANIYLISLFYQIIDEEKVITYEHFYPLVRMAIHENSDLSLFALYAIQVFYIRKKQTVFPILIAINKVMKEATICEEVAFTLLNLLNQLISLPNVSVDETNKDLFVQWYTELEAILIAHLASPYPVVRDITLIVMDRLDAVCARFAVSTTIASLLRVFDTTITQRVVFRLSNNTQIQSLDNIDFSMICRSNNYIVYSMYLVEFAQCICRNSMKPVLDNFLSLNLAGKLNFQEKNKTTYQKIWRNLPILSLTQRIVPVTHDTYIELTEKSYSLLPPTSSLRAYEIQKDLYTCNSQSDTDYLKERNNFWSPQMETLVKQMFTEKEMYTYHILSSVANASSIELLPAFMNSFLTTILTPKISSKTPLHQNLQSSIIRSCLLSPDFVLVPASNLLSQTDIIDMIFKWFHQFPIVEMGKNEAPETRAITLNYLTCVSAISDSLMCLSNIGSYGAVRAFVKTPWFEDESKWANEYRQKTFTILYDLMKNDTISDKVINPLLSFINSITFFTKDKTFPITDDYYQFFIKLEKDNQELRFLYPILNHHKFLLADYLAKSINSPIEKGFYYFRAYCDYFIYNHGGINIDDFKPGDLEANKEVVDLAGEIILTGLIFIGSSSDQCRKCAFELLKRILPILCTFYEKDDIQSAAIINSYLEEHRGELSIYPIAPTQQQCMELASKIADSMPFVIERIFHSFFTYFTAFERKTFTNISQSFLPLLLNIITPFATHLQFGEAVPVYPDNFHNPTTIHGLEFIRKFIAFYSCVLKEDHPLYVKVFEAMMEKEENIQPLATMLVMNWDENDTADLESNTLKATTTILLYLIQKQPAVIISLLTERLSYGFYFCKNHLQDKLLTEKPFKVRNWLNLSLIVLGEVANANFSLLLPYIHIILNYCLLSYNTSLRQINNNKKSQITFVNLRHLLQAIISHFSPEFVLPEKMEISFNSKQASEFIPIKSIISIFNKHLKKMYPPAIKEWKIESLLWATSCGFLDVAYNNAVVYSLLQCDPISKDAEKIILALNLVLQEYNYDAEKETEAQNTKLVKYARGSFKMLLSIVKRTLRNDRLAEVRSIFEFASRSCEITIEDQKLEKLTLKILNAFVSEKSTNLSILPEHLQSPLRRIARMLPLDFNNPNITKFLTSIIANLPSKNFEKEQYIALGLLAPIIYATFSAFNANELFSTFVENELIIHVRYYVSLLCDLDYDRNLSQIFEALYDILANNSTSKVMTPTEIIDHISQIIWSKKPEIVSQINQFYSIILQESINHKNSPHDEVREAVYEAAHSLLKLIPTQQLEQLPSFTNLLQYAIYDNTDSSRLLIEMHVIKQGPQEDATRNAIKKYVPEDARRSISVIDQCKEFKQILSDPRIFRTIVQEKTINFMEMKEASVLMLLTNTPHHFENQINALSNIEARPFEKQMEFWNNIESKMFEPVEQKEMAAPNPFDFFAHSKACNPIKATSAQLYAHKSCFDPQCFILRDEEFDEFEKRITFE